jgi:hypothetical protein
MEKNWTPSSPWLRRKAKQSFQGPRRYDRLKGSLLHLISAQIKCCGVAARSLAPLYIAARCLGANSIRSLVSDV